jgi:hypothetical protein
VARIFLCHASEDKAQVREVYHQLKALGFAPWLDEVDILPGQDWAYEIEQALKTSDFVIVFLSTRSVGKVGYVQREFRRALYHAEEMPEGFIHTIPVKLDDCVVPHRFSHHQWANLSEAGAFERIVRALHHGLQQRGQPLPEPFTHDLSSAQPETTPSPILQSPPQLSPPERPATQDTALEPLRTVEETLKSGAAASIQPPPKPASPGGDKPLDAVPQREEAATPLGNEKDRPEVHRYTPSNTSETTQRSRRHKRWRLWGGGVLLSVLVTALYLVLSGRTPGPQPHVEPGSAHPTKGTQPVPFPTNSLDMEFVLIPAGTFLMGSPDSDAEAFADEKPAHRVTISQPFYLGKYEVTQAQWEKVMGTNPSRFTGNPNRPVERVSWEDVQEFITRLNSLTMSH